MDFTNPRKVFLLLLVFVFLAAASLLPVSAQSESTNGDLFPRGRRILEKEQPNKLLKTPNQSSKNQTKLIKNTSSTKNNKTTSQLPLSLKNLNSTSKPIKKTLDLLKLATPKNKTTTKQPQSRIPKTEKPPKKQAKPKPNWIDDDDEDGDDDLVSEFRDLPTRFQKTLIPDLERISTTSKAYITKANKQMTMGFKPIVGNKYASTIASLTSFAFILIPLILVSLVFNRIKAYFSLQKLLIFIQIYLAIYFGILCFSSLITGLEPLKFFYSTSQSTYICLQVMQTLGYVLYLLLLVMYLVLVFSTDCGLGSRLLGLAQTFVGFAVGLHYYVAVFHRVVLHQPPRTNWKIHGIYATCFLVICVLAGAERRKKSYLEEDGAEGKKS